MSSGDVSALIATRVQRAVHAAFDLDITPAEAIVRVAKPGQGWDYQANIAMGLGKRLGKPPREVAATLVEHLETDDFAAPPEIGGPGFINFALRSSWIGEQAGAQLADPRLGVPLADAPRRIVVDYSAPNVAKEMHVGHLRSSIIGDALVRMLSHLGHELVPQNHLGDWGTPFGMLIEHMLDEGGLEGEHSIGDLNAFYQDARTKFDGAPEFQERARARVVQLQAGDEQTLSLWQGLVGESQKHFEEVYALLGVRLTPADLAPESLYNSRLAPTIEELRSKDLIVESDGALCVFPPGFKTREGEPLPLIAEKSGGGYTYDTTDLAAIRYRLTELEATELLYVVGSPQRIHFEMIFAAARMAGWLVEGDASAYHVQFGSVLGEDGKILRTRAGAPVRLIALLEEAVERAGEVIASRGAPSDAGLARAVGVGAVKYADLSSDRERDYVFSFDRMLSLEGNTSVYLQYANARCLSVLRKAGDVPAVPAALVLSEPAERDLALRLLRLPAALDEVLSDYRPHRLCTYLYETAAAYSAFYEQCPILDPANSDEVRASRLALCALTSKVLVQGLDLLGIEAPASL